jgi:hypothetical protein
VTFATDGGERAPGRADQERCTDSTHGDDPSDRTTAVGDLDLGAVLDRSKVPGQLVLQFGDLHPHHGHI